LFAGLWTIVMSSSAPVRANDFEKYLPDDTAFVVALNVKQLLEAPPIKRYGPMLMKRHWTDLMKLATQDDRRCSGFTRHRVSCSLTRAAISGTSTKSRA
jgi:hypothetical protein